jgi:hypothetical protein
MYSRNLSRKEITSNIQYRDKLLEGKNCPVCGKEAILKFYNKTKAKWIFKHIRLVKTITGGKVSETTYHEVA